MNSEHERHGVEVTGEAVAEPAYKIYLARGGQEGLAEEDWDKAEAELRATTVKNRLRRDTMPTGLRTRRP